MNTKTITEGIGIIYLVKSYQADPPIDPNAIEGMTDPNVRAITIRQTWAMLEKVKGTLDFGWIDAIVAACVANGKGFTFQILAGHHSPEWFFNEPNVTFIEAGKEKKKTSLVFCPVFQKLWTNVFKNMGKRFRDHDLIRFVRNGGVGIASESFVVKSPEERAAAEAAAKSLGYTDFLTGWERGTEWNIDMSRKAWEQVPTVLVTGNPTGDDDGSASLQAMFDYGQVHHENLFGGAAHDLTAGGPKDGQFSAEIIKQLSPTCVATGFQAGNEQRDLQAITDMLNRGTDFGAHWIEPFPQNTTNPEYAAEMAAANERMGA